MAPPRSGHFRRSDSSLYCRPPCLLGARHRSPPWRLCVMRGNAARLRSIFHEAAQALRFNRQRSILTTISLAWGVACVVILYSYGDGFHVALSTAFQAVGQDLV